MTRSDAQRLAHRWCGLAAIILLAAGAILGALEDYSLARQLWWWRCTGWGALGALFLALLVTPADRLLRRVAPGRVRPTTLLVWRRSFGITSAGLALLHAALVLTTYLRGSWPAVLEAAWLRAGLVAVVLLTALLSTSFPRLVARLGVRLWKALHRLSYVAAVFVFQHLILSPFAPRRLTLALFAGLLLLSALRWLPARRPGS